MYFRVAFVMSNPKMVRESDLECERVRLCGGNEKAVSFNSYIFYVSFLSRNLTLSSERELELPFRNASNAGRSSK